MFVTQTLLKVTSEQALTLQQLREIGCAMEEPEKQAHLIKRASNASNDVNSVGGKVDHRGDPSTRNVKCFWWDIKLTIMDGQLEGNSAENVMGQNILRLYVKLRGNKIVAQAEELEECLGQIVEDGVVDTIITGK